MSLKNWETDCKQAWLSVAEVIDSLRVVPRITLFGFGGLLGYVIVATMHWYFRITPIERTSQVTAVIGIIIPTLAGLAVWVFRIYSDGGRNWDAGNTVTTTTTEIAKTSATVAKIDEPA